PSHPHTTSTSSITDPHARPSDQHVRRWRRLRARELHELLGMPTDEASVNVTRSRLGRLVRQGFLTQPGRGRYQKRT
ncbi:hypothetical protein ABZ698_38475, partial [Streptomyces antibioticus]